jgi:hypothetical protein
MSALEDVLLQRAMGGIAACRVQMHSKRPDPPLLTAGRDLPQHTGARRVVTDATLIKKPS